MAKNTSGIFQGVAFFGRSKPKTGKGLWLSARTGYVDVTINGTRFYYNDKYQYSDISKVDLFNIQTDQENKNKKGIIVISRKRKG